MSDLPETLRESSHHTDFSRQPFRITTIRGPGPCRSYTFPRDQELVRIGRAECNDVCLQDPKVSREHMELRRGQEGLEIRNKGTRRVLVNNVLYPKGPVPPFAFLTLGDTVLRLEHLPGDAGSADRLCGMVGSSEVMRVLYKQLEKLAQTDWTILIEGETGTGKELAADAIHSLSQRRNNPLVKLNCGAFAATVLESELFGHEKGAFTGAISQRKGLFEIAHGGTIFLDEIGEMPMDQQVKLLRLLE
jgi:hypothetical protein